MRIRQKRIKFTKKLNHYEKQVYREANQDT